MNQDAAAGTQNAKAAEAYQLGLPGMRRGTPEGFRQALVNFTAATKDDPKCVNAYARLFEIHLMSEDHGLALIDGKTEKLKRLSARLAEIAPTNAQTHAAIAIVRFLNDWKWGEAEDEFKQALKLDPNCRMALTYYGYLLTRLGRASEAQHCLELARELDPSSPLIKKFLGHCEFVQRHYEKALPFYLDASEAEPSYPSAHYWAGRAYLAMTNYDQALDEFEQHELRQGLVRSETDWRFKNLRSALREGGALAYWTKRLEMMDDEDAYLRSPYKAAELYARLGDRPQALAWLEKTLAQHVSMEHLLVDEFWDSFRHEPRFKEILKKVGLDLWER
jgi:tetratricopeptide (TPR) repeat protein